MKQTKIVASISDLRCEVDFLRELYNAGVNVMRINTAHATPEGIKKVISNIREVSKYLAILIDTKGPEIRTTPVEEHIYFQTGDKVRICGNTDETTTKDTQGKTSYYDLYLNCADMNQQQKIASMFHTKISFTT